MAFVPKNAYNSKLLCISAGLQFAILLPQKISFWRLSSHEIKAENVKYFLNLKTNICPIKIVCIVNSQSIRYTPYLSIHGWMELNFIVDPALLCTVFGMFVFELNMKKITHSSSVISLLIATFSSYMVRFESGPSPITKMIWLICKKNEVKWPCNITQIALLTKWLKHILIP